MKHILFVLSIFAALLLQVKTVTLTTADTII